jgi:YjbE family integral membrane protein
MDYLAHLLDPSQWRGAFAESGDLGSATFWFAALRIILINIVLSGDNAVVIAMACRGLPPRQRLWGMVIGAGVAVVLLIVFTGIIAQLMQQPYLKLVGGLALFYIAAKLLVPEDSNDNEVEVEKNLWRAVKIVVVADVIMSLDNIIAVANAAQGNFLLLAIGLAVSIPIIIAGAALITLLLERLPILVWAGAGLLGWVAGEAVASDLAIKSYLTRNYSEQLAQEADWATAAAGVLLVLLIGGVWRHLHLARQNGREDGGRA